MNNTASYPGRSSPFQASQLLWPMFILYMLVSGYAMLHHEVWADEVHSWNISKGSHTYSDLLANKRYEGHPAAWYTVLWVLSKFTHNLHYMQAVQWAVACVVVYLFLFRSPLPLSARLLLPWGYYFLFEYSVFSRNYALGILLACCICLIIREEFKYKLPLYYTLLFLLSNVHLLSLLLAASFHVYFLLLQLEKKQNRRFILLHVLAGILVCLPAAYFVTPPSDGQMNVHFFLDRWNFQQIKVLHNIPLLCFIPIPAWWNYHFWNTQFLLSSESSHPVLLFVDIVLALILPILFIVLFRKSRKCMALFAVNLLLSILVSVVIFPLTSARYAGYVFISALVVFWLYSYERPLTGNNRMVLLILLLIQLTGGVFATVKDIRLPFSNLPRVKELITEVPANGKWVTDYWAMNGIVAFTDKPAYCIDMERPLSFILWDRDLASRQQRPNRYSSGIHDFFQRTGTDTVYMILQSPPQQLAATDATLAGSFRCVLIDKREGAIEPGSNLYLYQLTKITP
jgi:hypothetical protein